MLRHHPNQMMKNGSTEVARSQECSNMQERIGMAERVGFEPTVRFPVRSLSRRVLSTAQSPLRGRCRLNRSRALRFSVIGRGHYANALGSTELSLCNATGREGQRENRECTGQSQRYSRRAAKKDWMMAAHSAARTPEMTST